MCCLLKKADMEWGSPPSGAIRTPQIFPLIFCAFLRDSGTPIFQAPKRRRKISRKSAQKSAHQNAAQKWVQKSAHQKSVPERGKDWHQNLRTKKSAQKTGLNILFVWKMKATQKTQKKNLRQTCAKPPAPMTGSILSALSVLLTMTGALGIRKNYSYTAAFFSNY